MIGRSYSVFFYENYFMMRETYPDQRVDEEEFRRGVYKSPQEPDSQIRGEGSVVRSSRHLGVRRSECPRGHGDDEPTKRVGRDGRRDEPWP